MDDIPTCIRSLPVVLVNDATRPGVAVAM